MSRSENAVTLVVRVKVRDLGGYWLSHRSARPERIAEHITNLLEAEGIEAEVALGPVDPYLRTKSWAEKSNEEYQRERNAAFRPQPQSENP